MVTEWVDTATLALVLVVPTAATADTGLQAERMSASSLLSRRFGTKILPCMKVHPVAEETPLRVEMVVVLFGFPLLVRST